MLRCQERDLLQQFLMGHGIQSLIHYPIPPHKQKAYASLNNLIFPISEKVHNEVLSLPLSPVVTEAEVSYVIEILNKF